MHSQILCVAGHPGTFFDTSCVFAKVFSFFFLLFSWCVKDLFDVHIVKVVRIWQNVCVCVVSGLKMPLVNDVYHTVFEKISKNRAFMPFRTKSGFFTNGKIWGKWDSKNHLKNNLKTPKIHYNYPFSPKMSKSGLHPHTRSYNEYTAYIPPKIQKNSHHHHHTHIHTHAHTHTNTHTNNTHTHIRTRHNLNECHL